MLTRLGEAAKEGFAGAKGVELVWWGSHDDEPSIVSISLSSVVSCRQPVHPILFFSLFFMRPGLIALLSGRPARLDLFSRSPFLETTALDSASPKGPCIAAPSFMLLATNCDEQLRCCAVATPPHSAATLHTTMLQHAFLQMKPYRLQYRSLDMQSQPSQTPQVPWGALRWPSNALHPLDAFRSEPASVAADRPATSKI